MSGRSSLPLLLPHLTGEWASTREIATRAGVDRRVVRRTLQTSRRVEGLRADEGWLWRLRTPTLPA